MSERFVHPLARVSALGEVLSGLLPVVVGGVVVGLLALLLPQPIAEPV